MGQERKWYHARVMSVLPLKADISLREWQVRLVPEADIDEGRGMRFYRRCRPSSSSRHGVSVSLMPKAECPNPSK